MSGSYKYECIYIYFKSSKYVKQKFTGLEENRQIQNSSWRF